MDAARGREDTIPLGPPVVQLAVVTKILSGVVSAGTSKAGDEKAKSTFALPVRKCCQEGTEAKCCYDSKP
jgi:hypothetical protein|eukprot:evm.model.NODE_37006_length_97105_cov_39.404202.22